jgi:aryl-alcohol dehydrogenase-like predicted oxidoreductase
MLPRKRLGQTDIHISTLGLGTVKFGRNQSVKYPQAFDLPSDELLRELLNTARDLGVNLIDTAPAYGYSEERLGDLLRKERKEWIICTKVGEEFEADKFSNDGKSWFDFSPKHTRMSVERSLRRLRTDYLDMVLIHSDGNDLDILQNTGVLHTLQQLKQEGWIRAIGISSKTPEGGVLAAQHCDLVMVMHNPSYTDEEVVINECSRLGKGVLLKKVLASGHICHDEHNLGKRNNNDAGQDPIQTILDFVYANSGVTSAILGTLNVKHLRSNILKALSAQSVCAQIR